MSTTDNNAQRQAQYYQRAKAQGTLKKPLKVDQGLKERFDQWRTKEGLTVNDAFEQLLLSKGI